jgi:hypothetical protein
MAASDALRDLEVAWRAMGSPEKHELARRFSPLAFNVSYVFSALNAALSPVIDPEVP